MPLVLATPEERIGTLLAEKYRFDKVLGQGGMGTVFGGTHTWTGRGVAIKLLRPDLTQDRETVDRFLREARAAAQVHHPHAVDVLDMGRAEDGTVYMVLEWLEGESLSERLDRAGALTLEETSALLVPVMAALTFAHHAGIVHRDLKPSNIFVSRDKVGRTVPKLIDFGIAKMKEPSGAKVTATGFVVGTPSYMSPEQAIGDRTVGPQSDVWSIGVVLFECLAGRLPFEAATSGAILVMISTRPAPPLHSVAPHVSPHVAAVIDRALIADRAVRWQSMREMLEAFSAACDLSGVRLDDTARILVSSLPPPPKWTLPPQPSSDSAPEMSGPSTPERTSLPQTVKLTPDPSDVVPAKPLDSAKELGSAKEEKHATGLTWSEDRRRREATRRSRTWMVVLGVGAVGIAAAVGVTIVSIGPGRNATGARAPVTAPPAADLPPPSPPPPVTPPGPSGTAGPSAPVVAAPAPPTVAAVAPTTPVVDAGAALAPATPPAQTTNAPPTDRTRTTGRDRRRSKLAREW